MTPLAVVLVSVSSVMHAWWNMASKRVRCTYFFFWVISLVGWVICSPVLVYAWGRVPPGAWICLGASGGFLAVYFASLAAAYGAGEMSVVYPVARSLPVAALCLVDLLKRERLSVLGASGLVLVAAGLLTLVFGGRGPKKKALCWACLTALGTIGYTVSDKLGVEFMRAAGSDALRTGCLYGWLEFGSFVVVGAPFALLGRKPLAPARPRDIALVGVLNVVAYFLVLAAYVGNPASYVYAFRQMSIVLGTLAGVFILKERGGKRVLASAAVAAGLLCLALA